MELLAVGPNNPATVFIMIMAFGIALKAMDL